MVDSEETEKTIIEIVAMEDDGSLNISHVSLMKDVSPGMNMWVAQPGTHDFIEFQNRHGVTKPGQRSTIKKELRAGEWHENQVKEGDWD